MRATTAIFTALTAIALGAGGAAEEAPEVDEPRSGIICDGVPFEEVPEAEAAMEPHGATVIGSLFPTLIGEAFVGAFSDEPGDAEASHVRMGMMLADAIAPIMHKEAKVLGCETIPSVEQLTATLRADMAAAADEMQAATSENQSQDDESPSYLDEQRWAITESATLLDGTEVVTDVRTRLATDIGERVYGGSSPSLQLRCQADDAGIAQVQMVVATANPMARREGTQVDFGLKVGDEVRTFGGEVGGWGGDYLYVADSLGALEFLRSGDGGVARLQVPNATTGIPSVYTASLAHVVQVSGALLATCGPEAAKPSAEEPLSGDSTQGAPDDLAATMAEAVAKALEGSEVPVKAAPLSQGERDALRVAVERCWTVDPGLPAASVTVIVGMRMTPDAKPDTASIGLLGSAGGDEAAVREAYEAARRAILRCGADGFPLPAGKYERWAQLEMTFNPEGMRVR